MNSFLDQLAKLGPMRLIVMFGVAAGVAGALAMVSMGVGRDRQALLYSGLDLREVGAITETLDQAGVEYTLEGGGTSIYVAPEEVTSARLLLSAEGLPGSGSIGYEIFDSQDALGSTQFVQNVNKVRALEGEFARTIRELQGVSSARVHLALPQRRLFDREAGEAKASVWIDLRNPDLGASHARTIQRLIAGGVPGLSASAVTVLDTQGRLLAGGTETGEDGMIAAAEERRVAIEESLRRKVLGVVERVVGPGNAAVQVTAEVDLDRISETAETFDPEGRALRSTVVTEETSNESGAEIDGLASVSENVPEEETTDSGPRTQSQSETERLSETSNWEVSRTTRTQVREAGAITRLSVAVAVDGVTTIGEDGAPVYTPRSEAEMAQIATLVRSAIGFEEARGDVVEVANVAFARVLPMGAGTEGAPIAFDQDDILRGVELIVLLIVSLLIIFFVARPLLQGAIGGGRPALAGAGAGGGVVALGAPSTALLPGADGAPALPAPDEDGEVAVERITGNVKAASIRKVAEIVDNHPDESVAILRGWLHEG